MTENQLKYLSYLESKRHNLRQEGLSADTLQETVRSNLTREAETYRGNTVKEAETERHNRVQENIAIADTAIKGVKAVGDTAKNANSIVRSVGSHK